MFWSAELVYSCGHFIYISWRQTCTHVIRVESSRCHCHPHVPKFQTDYIARCTQSRCKVIVPSYDEHRYWLRRGTWHTILTPSRGQMGGDRPTDFIHDSLQLGNGFIACAPPLKELLPRLHIGLHQHALST